MDLIELSLSSMITRIATNGSSINNNLQQPRSRNDENNDAPPHPDREIIIKAQGQGQGSYLPFYLRGDVFWNKIKPSRILGIIRRAPRDAPFSSSLRSF